MGFIFGSECMGDYSSREVAIKGRLEGARICVSRVIAELRLQWGGNMGSFKN